MFIRPLLWSSWGRKKLRPYVVIMGTFTDYENSMYMIGHAHEFVTHDKWIMCWNLFSMVGYMSSQSIQHHSSLNHLTKIMNTIFRADRDEISSRTGIIISWFSWWFAVFHRGNRANEAITLNIHNIFIIYCISSSYQQMLTQSTFPRQPYPHPWVSWCTSTRHSFCVFLTSPKDPDSLQITAWCRA